MEKFVPKRFIDHIFSIKFRASSIIEVIVALAICMIIFGISMSVILNSQRSNSIRLKQKAQFILSTIDTDTLQEDANFQNGSIKLEASVQEFDTIPGAARICYYVIDNAGHKLAMRVVWLPADNISSRAEVITDEN